MKDNVHPFPGQPNDRTRSPLPVMSQDERKLWAASHNLPKNMILLSVPEMAQINLAIRTVDAEVKEWRRRFKILVDSEEVVEASTRIHKDLQTLKAYRADWGNLSPKQREAALAAIAATPAE